MGSRRARALPAARQGQRRGGRLAGTPQRRAELVAVGVVPVGVRLEVAQRLLDHGARDHSLLVTIGRASRGARLLHGR